MYSICFIVNKINGIFFLILYKNKQMFSSRVVFYDTDPYGSPHGPITSKYHIFTMEMRFYVYLQSIVMSLMYPTSHTSITLQTNLNVLYLH